MLEIREETGYEGGKLLKVTMETAGNGSETLTVEVLAEEAVDDRVGSAVAVPKKLEDGKDCAGH